MSNGISMRIFLFFLYFLTPEGPCMSSQSSEINYDKINQDCYDNCYWLWDRFPFPEILPQWIVRYHSPSLDRVALDIGSGTGQLAKWLQNQGFDLLCIDPSPVMIKECRAKGLTCLQTTFQNFHSSKSFSEVFAVLSFIHIPKKEWPEQMDKVADLLKPEGLFFLAVIQGENESVVQDPSLDFPRFFAYFTQNEIIKLTEKKFELLDCATLHGPEKPYLLVALRKRY